MDSTKRLAVYWRQRNGGRLTPKQNRRYERKYWREIRKAYQANPDRL